MPTGYTHDIKNGISFQEYAMNCARAFGACITMRDDPISTPIPEEFETDSYHSKRLNECIQELDRFNNNTDNQLHSRFSSYIKENIESNKQSIKEKRDLKHKYEEMLDKVNSFKPPTKEHVEFKEFMINQIKESIDFDCNIHYYYKQINTLENITFEEWKKDYIENLEEHIAYHMKKEKEEEEICLKRSMWAAELRDAIEEVE